MFYAVIMAGGSGTRMWPTSRQDPPKQAIKIVGDRSMFQYAVERIASVFPSERIFVVTCVTCPPKTDPATMRGSGQKGGRKCQKENGLLQNRS